MKIVAKGPWYEIRAMAGASELSIYGEIGWEVLADEFIRQLDGAVKDTDALLVRISSPGGDVGQGLAIYNRLLRHEGDVTVSIEGYALSMGSIIAMAGDVVEASAASLFMIHDPLVMAYGNAEELRKTADTLDVVRDALLTAYLRRVSDRDQLIAWMQAETWFTAEEARAAGFIDQVNESDIKIAACASLAAPILEKFRNVPEALRATVAKSLPAIAPAQPAVPANPGGQNMADPIVAVDAAKVVADERKRVADIRAAFAPHGHETLRDELIDAGAPIETAREKLLAKLAEGAGPVGRVTVVEDRFDKMAKGMRGALLARAQIKGAADDTRNDFRGFSLVDMAREYVRAHGRSDMGMSRMDLVALAFSLGDRGYAGRILNAAAMGTDSFTSLLADVATKSAFSGYEQQEEIYRQAARIVSMTDFKAVKFAGISEFSSLDAIGEHEQYANGKFTDLGTNVQLATYGKLFNLSRHAIVNDDLQSFTRIPALMGAAAARKVGDLFAAVFTANAAMDYDAVTLFHADHANTTTGAAPSTTQFEALRVLMAKQTGPQGAAYLNLVPSICLVPHAYYGQARVVVESDTEISSSQNNSRRPNSARGMVTVLADARFDANSATAYYMTSNPQTTDAVVVGLLDGMDQPTIEQVDMWSMDGVAFKVRMDAVAEPIDHRCFVRSAA